MHSFSIVSILVAALVSSVVDAENCSQTVETTLGPILDPGVDINNVSNIALSHNVALHYSSDATITPFNITLEMKYPTVFLEQVASIAAVDCTATNVTVTFASGLGFNKTIDEWYKDGNFVMITNHMGDCDKENERGWFLVESLVWDASAMVVVASSSPKNITTTATTGRFNFGAQSAVPVSKRNLVVDPGFTISGSVTLPPNTVLYSHAPYLTVTANEASVSAIVAFSGYLEYNFIRFHLDALHFDIDAALNTELNIAAAASAPYNTTIAYAPEILTYSLVDIPGILSLGPAASFAVGATLSASAAATISASGNVGLADGKVHLDLLSSSSSSTGGWTPTYSVSANASAAVDARIDPYIAATVEIDISPLSGLLDLSSGITARPSLPSDFTLTATGIAGVDPATGCSNGLRLQSAFAFELDAFVTRLYNRTLYKYSTQFLDECFSWAK